MGNWADHLTGAAIRILGAVLLVTLAACGGDDGATGGSDGAGDGGDAAPTADAASDDWEHERLRCDGLRAEGTITNTSGEPAAFVISYSFAYSDPSSGPGLESERTPVLDDGESHGYRISPRSVTEPATDCTFLGIDRAEPTEAAGTEADSDRPDTPLRWSNQFQPYRFHSGVPSPPGIGSDWVGVLRRDATLQLFDLDDGGERFRAPLTFDEYEGFEVDVDPSAGTRLAGPPVDAGDVVLVALNVRQNDDRLDASRHGVVAALDAETGERVWAVTDVELDPQGPPVVDDDRVYVTASPGEIVAFSLDDGEELWRAAGPLGPAESITYPFSTSPVVVDDLVIVPGGESGFAALLAFDAGTGEPRWTSDQFNAPETFAPPVVDGDTLHFAGDGSVHSFAVATGATAGDHGDGILPLRFGLTTGMALDEASGHVIGATPDALFRFDPQGAREPTVVEVRGIEAAPHLHEGLALVPIHIDGMDAVLAEHDLDVMLVQEDLNDGIRVSAVVAFAPDGEPAWAMSYLGSAFLGMAVEDGVLVFVTATRTGPLLSAVDLP